MVSVLTFYSEDPSSNPAEAYSFFCNIVFEKNENKQKKRPGLAHFLKRNAVRQNFIVNGEILTYNLAIWSHCSANNKTFIIPSVYQKQSMSEGGTNEVPV